MIKPLECQTVIKSFFEQLFFCSGSFQVSCVISDNTTDILCVDVVSVYCDNFNLILPGMISPADGGSV